MFVRTRSRTRRFPRQERAIFTVNAILDAADRLVGDAGDGELTMTELARVAGVSIGTVYHYFPDRPAVLEALLERDHRGLLDKLVELGGPRPAGPPLVSHVAPYGDVPPVPAGAEATPPPPAVPSVEEDLDRLLARLGAVHSRQRRLGPQMASVPEAADAVAAVPSHWDEFSETTVRLLAIYERSRPAPLRLAASWTRATEGIVAEATSRVPPFTPEELTRLLAAAWRALARELETQNDG